jgi:ubiquitin C-terminal hydrolase
MVMFRIAYGTQTLMICYVQDCEHVSRTLEEFYTVRCQVADMRNLYESLDEVTVKDTLEGDNMYTCSQCGKKVRAEKRLVILQEIYVPLWLYVFSVTLFGSCIIFL